MVFQSGQVGVPEFSGSHVAVVYAAGECEMQACYAGGERCGAGT